jgi:hypothetical protein
MLFTGSDRKRVQICAGIEAPEPDDSEFAQFEAINQEVFDTFAVDGKIRIDYETEVSFGRPYNRELAGLRSVPWNSAPKNENNCSDLKKICGARKHDSIAPIWNG